MKKILLIILFTIPLYFNSSANQTDTIKIDLKISPFDYQYQKAALQVYHPYQIPFSPSMHQALDITSSVYNLTFATIDKIQIKNNPLIGLLAQTSAYYLGIIALTYFPFGDSWLHEEFHRSILTFHGISSYDQVYNFPLFSELISVNNVQDSDLINFKRQYPSDFIRLPEAGIEGEYLLITELEKKNFFLNQKYPYYITEQLITLNSILYVWMCHTQQAEEITINSNTQEQEIKDRDFTGLDFTAWVYDLFRPNEPYTDRGIHPSGIGIDRYIKPSDLMPQEINYLKKSAYWQLTNLLSPFLFGINKIHLNQWGYNFAFRHFLTSFGWDLAIYNFIQNRNLNIIITPHIFSNYYKSFPGLELSIINNKLLNNKLLADYRIFLFSQPQNLDFYSRQYMPGLFFSTNLSYALNKHWYLNLEIEAKTKGWIPGVVNQNSGINFFAGLRFSK